MLYIDRKGGLRSFARKHAASLRTRSFYYLFVDDKRDGPSGPGAYHNKVWGGTGMTGTSLRGSIGGMQATGMLPSAALDEPMTIGEVARRRCWQEP